MGRREAGVGRAYGLAPGPAGVGGVHTTAAANLAALIETVAHRPGTRVLNSADPDAPSALEICRTIAGHLGHEWEEVLLDDTAPAGLGRTPWDSPHPIVLDTSAATALGYQAAGTYAATIAPALDWLVDAARDGQPRRRRLLRGVLRLRGRGRVSREAGRAARAMTGRGGPPHGWKRHRPSERTSTLPSLTRMAVSSSMK